MYRFFAAGRPRFGCCCNAIDSFAAQHIQPDDFGHCTGLPAALLRGDDGAFLLPLLASDTNNSYSQPDHQPRWVHACCGDESRRVLCVCCGLCSIDASYSISRSPSGARMSRFTTPFPGARHIHPEMPAFVEWAVCLLAHFLTTYEQIPAWHSPRLLATCSADHLVKIWNMADYSLDKTLQAHTQWVWDCVFTIDSAYLVTGLLREFLMFCVLTSLFLASSDRRAMLWELQTARPVKTYTGHHKPVVCVAMNDNSVQTAPGPVPMPRSEVFAHVMGFDLVLFCIQ